MSSQPSGPLRTHADPAATAGASDAAPAADEQFGTISDLVADLLAVTQLVGRDRLAAARGRAGAGSLAEALDAEGVATPDGIAMALARRYNLPFADISRTAVPPEVSDLVPVRTLQRVGAVPIAVNGDRLQVAVSNPGDIHGIDELRLATRYAIDLCVASRDDISAEVARISRMSEFNEAQSVLDEIAYSSDEDEEDLEADDGVSDAPLVRLVNSIIMQAAGDGASDIHFEPQEESLTVRVRVDGVLTEAQRIPKRMANGVTTRLKVLSKLDIAERRKPQDGRISLNARSVGRLLDIRVAVLPTVDGEKVVMRLIDKSRKTPTLESLGLSEVMRQKIGEIIRKPTAGRLVMRPTDSGKATRR